MKTVAAPSNCIPPFKLELLQVQLLELGSRYLSCSSLDLI